MKSRDSAGVSVSVKAETVLV